MLGQLNFPRVVPECKNRKKRSLQCQNDFYGLLILPLELLNETRWTSQSKAVARRRYCPARRDGAVR